MSTTTIKFRNASFAANDLPIEVWMLEVAVQIDRNANTLDWLHELQAEWRLQATSGFGFGPTPALDRFLTDVTRQDQLAEIVDLVRARITDRTSDYSRLELETLGIGGPNATYTKDLPREQVLEVGDSFLELVRPLRTP